MTNIDLSVLCETNTYKQNVELLTQVLKRLVGEVPLSDGSTVMSLFSHDDIQPDEYRSLSKRSYSPLRPKRLIILEPVYEQVIKVETREVTTAGRFWWRKETVKHYFDFSKRLRTVPRSAWRIDNIFVGSTCLFPDQPNYISGDAFGFSDVLDFGKDTPILRPGVDFTIGLRHMLSDPVPFVGLLLCERPNQEE